MRTLNIQTPEKVDLEIRLAGPGQRIMALVIDIVIVSVLNAVATVGFISLSILGGFGQALGLLAFFIVNSGYFIILEYKYNGQSFGKKAMKIRVRKIDGTAVGFYEVFLRNIMRGVDCQPCLMLVGPGFYLLGALVVILNRHSRRLGDLVAGTVVVREEQRMKLPDRIMAPQEKYNSLFEDRALVERINQIVMPSEKEILIELCIRRDALDLQARMKIFREYAAYFKKRFRIGEKEFLSDERLVINIAVIALGREE
ncbi:MAG: RDD family protein [Planctomycetota bacterium]|jgi:uncharacterized RDD family membrane protein YckC